MIVVAKTLLPSFSRVNKSPQTGVIKQKPTDFIVNEKLAYVPIGEGEHAFILIRKTSETTQRVAQQIARLANVTLRQVSYAGLKDKHGVTCQWFSVHLPGKDSPDWTELNSEFVHVEQSTRHDRKLRRGQIRSNCFAIVVRDYSGSENDLSDFKTRVTNMGVPNYFTEQRFGIEGNNLNRALELTASDTPRIKNARARQQRDAQRGMYISAARSLLFNCVLSERVERGNWCSGIDGDLYMKAGRHGMFSVDNIDDELLTRLELLEISPTGPMFGLDSDMKVLGEALELENDIMQHYAEFQALLIALKVESDRRALRLPVLNLEVSFDMSIKSHNKLTLEFELQSGSYATAVLRELIQYPGGMN